MTKNTSIEPCILLMTLRLTLRFWLIIRNAFLGKYKQQKWKIKNKFHQKPLKVNVNILTGFTMQMSHALYLGLI